MLMLLCFLVLRSASLLPQSGVIKMPILEKTPPKMAAKSPSSEEEPVSDVWSSLSLIPALPTQKPLLPEHS